MLLRFPAALSVVVLLCARAFAGDGSQVWRTLESEHFVVYYYEPNGDVARRVATVAEHAHRLLAPALEHEPDEKTHIVITDDIDGANGFANVLPRNEIDLFVSAPDSLSVLNDHDDWLYGLVAHEYTHILHLDTIGGLPWLYNRVFGKTWAPNNIQPRWFVEGLATYEESKRSAGGRTRSAMFDAYMRVAVLAGKRLDIDQVSSGDWYWPHGHIVYLYGSVFLKYIGDRYGDEKLAQISKEYGKQPVPYGLSRALLHATGKDALALFDEWAEYVRRKYTLQKDAVVRRGLIEGRKLTHSGEGNNLPRYRPGGGEIVWGRSDGRSRFGYRVMAVGADGDSARDLALVDVGGDYSLLPDGSGMVFERGITYRTNYSYYDLYRLDFADQKITRLTVGARVLKPDVSPDGQWLAFEQNGGSRRRLAIMPLAEGAEPEVVWEGAGRWDQAYQPAWSPDGKRLAFSAWTQGGDQDIYVLDVKTRALTRLTEDRAIDASPRWLPDGRLAFVSDRTGIYNVFLTNPVAGESILQVTNVLGGVITFDVSPDGKRLVYQGLDAEGTDLWELPLEPSRFLPAEVYVDDRPDPVAIPDGEVAVSAPRDYRPLETLAPLSYTVRTAVDSFGSAVTVSVGGSDIIGRHGYSLGVTYGLSRGDVDFGAGYAYRRFWPGLGISVARSVGRVGGLVVDGSNTQYEEEDWAASASVSLPVLRDPGLNSDLSFSYDLDYRRNLDPLPPPNPGSAVTRPPETGLSAGVSMRWSMSNVRRYIFSIGPADGYALALSLRFNEPALGSDFRGVELGYSWQSFFELPWEHILSLRLAGGFRQNHRRRAGDFYLGSTPQQDIASAIINSTRVGTAYLHGFPPGLEHGSQYHILNSEYRLHLATIEKGLATLPFYFRRLHAAALVDVAEAVNEFDPGKLQVAVGAALRLDVLFGYFASGTFDFGVARGLTEGGTTEYWLLLTQTL